MPAWVCSRFPVGAVAALAVVCALSAIEVSAVQVIFTFWRIIGNWVILSLFNDFGLMFFMSNVKSPDSGLQLPGVIVPLTVILKEGASAMAPALAAQARRAAKSLLVRCFIDV